MHRAREWQRRVGQVEWDFGKCLPSAGSGEGLSQNEAQYARLGVTRKHLLGNYPVPGAVTYTGAAGLE